mgnify:CR=1 FL=1
MPRTYLPVWSCAEAARKERAFLRGSEAKSLALMRRAATGIRDEIVAQALEPLTEAVASAA